MSWPSWIEPMREAYLANTASVCLLHGPGVARGSWQVDGEAVNCIKILTAFLSGSREVVGLLAPPQALRFEGLGDVGQFERLVSTAMVLNGVHLPLQDDVPAEALGKIWLALATQNTPQGYVVAELAEIYPGQRERLIELGAEAPDLWNWCTHSRIRDANHIVLLLTEDLTKVRSELVQAAHLVQVPMPGIRTTPVSPAPEPVSPTAPKLSDDALNTLKVEVEAAVRLGLDSHPTDHWAAKIPFMDAAAQVLTAHTGSPGPLDWSVDEDGKAIATGDGAESFLSYWRSDIVLDASAGMILSDMKGGLVPDELSATGLRALTKRLFRAI
ncbi:MAG: hypothetical protein GWP91_19480 [Rhodobacterales bacterium]|nr:hypothetical protein [Rhodobacterales bacterium]